MSSIRWLTARVIFYPTLGWNMLLGRLLKVRNWHDHITPNVIIGAFPFSRDIEGLAKIGVGGIVNTCEEYDGAVDEYERLAIEQFRMPTIDFTHPRFEDVCNAVEFIDQQIENGHKVYVHCKAGRGRSATVGICWLMKNQQINAQEAQKWMLEKRPHVNAFLTERPVVQQFEKEFVKS